MTDLKTKLTEIKARCDKATPGPWDGDYLGVHTTALTGEWYDKQKFKAICVDNSYSGQSPSAENSEQDFQFIAASRTDVPMLVEALEVLLEANEFSCQSTSDMNLKSDEEAHYYQIKTARKARARVEEILRSVNKVNGEKDGTN